MVIFKQSYLEGWLPYNCGYLFDLTFTSFRSSENSFKLENKVTDYNWCGSRIGM